VNNPSLHCEIPDHAHRQARSARDGRNSLLSIPALRLPRAGGLYCETGMTRCKTRVSLLQTPPLFAVITGYLCGRYRGVRCKIRVCQQQSTRGPGSDPGCRRDSETRSWHQNPGCSLSKTGSVRSKGRGPEEGVLPIADANHHEARAADRSSPRAASPPALLETGPRQPRTLHAAELEALTPSLAALKAAAATSVDLAESRASASGP
jgi:hypothetical protein